VNSNDKESMMMKTLQSNRRSFLRGVGACVAMPAFASLTKASAVSNTTLATTPSGAPLRMAFMSIPNGVQQRHWFPEGEGKDFKLNTSMTPLESLKQHVQIIAGLKHEHATSGNDGAGDHARANATFLTGARARKTPGKDIFVGTSIDQVAAQAANGLTRFSSLELSCDAIRNSGSCDSGYACAYQYNLSWSSPTTPVTPEPNPRLVFERLFGEGEHGQRTRNMELRQNAQKSVLDFVIEDAASVRQQLATDDRRKLDEYLDGVRSLEQRIKANEQLGPAPDPNSTTPSGIPSNFGTHMEMMYDLMILAFQTDSTRIGTLLLSYDGSNRIFPDIGITEGHHYLTHNQQKADLADKVAQIDQYYMKHFARFLERMQSTQDVDGRSLLANSMIVYGGAIADGNRHTHDNLPVILAGEAGGMISPGRYLKVDEAPMSNLFVSMLRRFGVTTSSFGDSTGDMDSVVSMSS
jgi:hypothetical protein